MASKLLTPLAGAGILGLAVLYQTHLSDSLFAFAGIGRSVDPLLAQAANAKCEVIPELTACEDAWLHEESGLLYLACSSLPGRRAWLPTMDRLNAKERPKTDAIYILDTNAKGPAASRITKLQTPDFSGINGDGTLNLHGIGVLEVPSKPNAADSDGIAIDASYSPPTLYLYINNHRPPLDPATGQLIDAHKTGANSTVEIFKTTLGSPTASHVRTYAHDLIATPNRVAPVGPDSFLFVNDHGLLKTGLRRHLSMVFNDGNVGYCDPQGCKLVVSSLGYPNGIVASAKPRQYWVPTMRDGKLKLFEFQPKDQSLVSLDDIHLDGPPGYPADNLAITTSTGALLTASPTSGLHALLNHFANFEKLTPTTVHRVTLNDGRDKFFGSKYKVEKLLEFDGDKLGGYTTAVEDGKRGRVWVMGVGVPHVAVCSL